MGKKFKEVYQFKITLKGIKPPIWRRIQVPGNYSFWDLHVAIQDAMGWFGDHLHAFEIVNPKTGFKAEIGIPDAYKKHLKKYKNRNPKKLPGLIQNELYDNPDDP